MKRNLFLSLILLPLPLTAEAVSGHFSVGNGGVAALPNEETSSLTISGSQSYSDCVANGQGGVYAVLAEGSLTLHTDGGDVMEFTDNRDCAAPSPTGVGFRGIPNDVYLGTGAELIVDTAADSEIIMRSGITADSGSWVIKQGSGTWTLAGTAEASRFRGNLMLNEGTLVLGEGCIFGAPSASSFLIISSNLQLQEEAAPGFRMICLEQGGSITGTLHTFNETLLMVDGAGFTINGGMELAGGAIQFLGGSLIVNGDIRTYADTSWEIVPDYYEIGGRYEILTCTGEMGEGGINFGLPTDSRTIYKTETEGNTIVLHVSGSAAKRLTWQGGKGMFWTASPSMQAWQDEENGAAESFYSYDVTCFTQNGSVAIGGQVMPGNVLIDVDKALTFTVDKKLGGGICGANTAVDKTGAGTLTLNNGNSYAGGTILDGGTVKATGETSFGTGAIRAISGTLDFAGKAIANELIIEEEALVKNGGKFTGTLTLDGNLLKGSSVNLTHTAELENGTVDGVLSGIAGALVSGDVTFNTKNTYKGSTTIQAGGHLTIGEKGAVSGNITILGGKLTINSGKGLTAAKNTIIQLNGGSIKGLLTIGAGSTLEWNGGDMVNAPVLKGGTLDLGGASALTLTGSKAQVAFGDKVIDLPGKGIVRSDETLNVLSGTVKLTEGAEHAAVKVSGNAALVNGATHSGDIIVNGTLAKGTTIKLIGSHQTVNMNGAGITAAAISGIGTVNVNLNAGERIDATAAKLTAANINLNGGTFTNTKGIKLVKGQTLTLNGANVNLGTKGILTTAAGSTLKVSESATLSGSLTLGGGGLVFEGAALTVKGTLTLSKPVSVTGSGTLICDSVKPFKGDLGTLFGGADVKLDGTTLTINGGATKKSLVAAPVAEEEAPLDAAPALPTLPEMPATNPVADAIAQADWGILDANRAFTGAVSTRHQHAALLDKGQGAAWVSAFGASVRHGNQGAHHGSDGNIEGAALGMEHSVSETGVLGLAVGRSKNRIGATGVSRLRQETAHVALYGQKQFKHNLTADATAAWGDTETKLGGSSWQQKSAALSGRLTHAHMLNDATAVRTFGGFSYEATESGSFGAAERSGSVQNLRAEVGAGATHAAGKAHFYGEASLTGDLIRHNPSVELGGIRHHGASPGRLGVKGTFGAFYSFTDTWTGTASYSIEAESRSTSHTVNIGVSKSF